MIGKESGGWRREQAGDETRSSMLRGEGEEERNVSFMLIPAGAALRLTTMLSLLISPADVVVTSCWYTCRPNLVAPGASVERYIR